MFEVGPGTPQINAIPLTGDVVSDAPRATNRSEANVGLWDVASAMACHQGAR